MKTIICDCCGDKFEYGVETAKTDGEFRTVKLDCLSVRVCLSVKALNPVTQEFADICPDCRVKAIVRLLGGSIS